MKITTNGICFFIILLINSQAFSQKQEHSAKDNTSKGIVWDFSTGKITEPCCIAKGKNIPIKIINVNRNIFDVVIDPQFLKFSSEPLEILDFEKMKANVSRAQAQLADRRSSFDENAQAKALGDLNNLGTALNNFEKVINCGQCLSHILNQNLSFIEAKAAKVKCTESLGLDEYISKRTLGSRYLQIIQTEVLDFELAEAIQNIELIYDKISDSKTFEVSTTVPIQEAYQLALKLSVTPKKKEEQHGEERNLVYPINGIKISFSPGFFINHFPGAQNYYLKDYQLNGNPTDSVTIKSTFDDKSLIPSIGALIHVSFFGCSDVDFALSAGASTRLETGSMRWHLGTSLLLGKQKRFVLSVGATLGQGISELNQSYEIDRPYQKSTIQNQTITSDVPHVGWFIGFSYNLPAKPKA